MPKTEFFARYKGLGFYNNPPESLLFKTIFKGLTDDEHIRDWSNKNRSYFPNYYAAMRLSPSDIYGYVYKFSGSTYETTFKAVQDLGVETYTEAVIPILFPYFDSFGLASTLLEFLTKVYVADVLRMDRSYASVFVEDLRRMHVKKGDVEYSDAELLFCAIKLIEFARRVLYPMASLVRDERDVAGRGSILTRFPLANDLYDQLTAQLAAPAVAPAAAVADNGSAFGGAGIGPAPAPPAPQHNRYAGEVPLNGNTSSEYSPSDSAGGRRRTRRGRKYRRTSRKN
jgi:hypothetical protein